jgi:DNA repair exonuclease SbcCD ATPase subunit
MIIPVQFDTLKSIVHIADTHIRLFRRHDEYEAAFETLYADIRSKNLKDFVIVLAGDIVHAKTDMSPEMVEVTSRFLSNIADIAPTILIAGNHDCNLANTNRLDSLTPIVNSLQHPDLHYIKYSAIVTVADTNFAIMSIFDEATEWPRALECDKPNKIALYHGPVHGSTTDAGFTITNRHVHVDTFNGFDAVLLGDIHKHQVLQESNPIIVYASSLIQQHHGESLENHGWCLWNVPNRSFEFIPLHNDYGYVTLEALNGNITYPPHMPKNVRMRLFTGDLDNTQVKKIITTLRNNHNIIELSVNKSRFNKTINRSTTVAHDAMDLTDVSLQNTLITDWLTRNTTSLDADVLTAVHRINTDLNSKIHHDDQSRNIHWRPLKFTFSNMFSYGEDNEINFTDMKGLYGIFAANASGKSSIMDSLMFCLYDKTPRAFKGDHIINNRKDTFECELTFEINNEVYGIKRKGTRKKNGDVKVDAQFWKVSPTGNISLNGEDRRDTNANIRNYVGSYEDFVMTALSGQNNNALFIDKSHSERKDLLIQFMGLNIFDKLFDAAHDEAKEITGVLKRFKKSEVTDNIASTHNQLATAQEEVLYVEVDHMELKESREVLDDLLISTQELKRPVPATSGNLVDLTKALTAATFNRKKAQEDVAIAEYALTDSKANLADALSDFEQYDMVALKESVTNWNKLNEILVKGNSALRVVNTKIDEKTKFKNKLSSYNYNPNCDVCVANNGSIIEDLAAVNNELDELNAKRLIQEDSITQIIDKMKPLEMDKELYEEALVAQKEIESCGFDVEKSKTVLASCKVVLEKIEISIPNIENEIVVYKTNEENILHNQAIDIDITQIQEKITVNKKMMQSVEQNLRTLHGNISVLESKKQELMNKLKEAEELEITYEAYSQYMAAIGRDGIPYELMSKAIPNIESEINSILSQIVDFTVSLEVDGKNINGKLSYDYDRIWPLENSSGMERFVSSLAIRIALMNASNLPKSNFFVADEGFGVLDAEHVGHMQVLFNILKTHFDFVIIISHLDIMRDMVDGLLEIKKEDGYSQVSI